MYAFVIGLAVLQQKAWINAQLIHGNCPISESFLIITDQMRIKIIVKLIIH